MRNLLSVFLIAALGGALYVGLKEVLRPKQELPEGSSNGLDDLSEDQKEAMLDELSQQL